MGEDEREQGDDDGEPALGFKVRVGIAKEADGSEVWVRWMKGRDTVLFESFCGMVRREAMKQDDS